MFTPFIRGFKVRSVDPENNNSTRKSRPIDEPTD